MKKEKILLVLDSENKYRQKQDQYESIDIEAFISELKALGYEVATTNYKDIVNNIALVEGETIVYTSHQQLDYKKYIEDILYILKDKNTLVPSYESLLCHENKEFQELKRKELKLDDLNSFIISDTRELESINLKYPIVIKRPNSCSSAGVYLAHTKTELEAIIEKHFIPKDFNYYLLNAKKIIKSLIHKDTLSWTEGKINDYKYSRFILQDFIPNLDGDYKILVYGDKYYGLKRGVKKGDFKASGSGIHDYDSEIPREVLSFAKSCFEKLNIPFAGFDIAIDGNKKCYLIEFQSIHIGPATLMHSKKYYKYNQKWEKYEETSIIEQEYARAIAWYLKNNKRD